MPGRPAPLLRGRRDPCVILSLMDTNLEASLNALRGTPLDVELAEIEQQVWTRLGALRRRQAHAAAWGWRAAVAAFMAAVGAVTGGAAAAHHLARDVSPFLVQAEWAPSTLLGDDT